MKKLLIILALFGLSACGINDVETVKMTEVETFPVDMSAYANMNSVDHQFVGVKPTDFIDIVNNDGSALFYIGYSSCPICNEAVPLINQAAKELGLKVYYIDAYSETYPLIDYYDEFIEVIKPILKLRDGEPILYTPHVVAVKNGEFVADIIGLGKVDDLSTEKNYEKALNAYKDVMKYFDAE